MIPFVYRKLVIIDFDNSYALLLDFTALESAINSCKFAILF